jgi:hypothetical protein
VKRFAFGVLMVVLSGLALVVTAEFVLRATGSGLRGGRQRELHQLRLDRPWIYGLRPGARLTLPRTGDVVYEINRDGFRDRLYPREVPDGRLRILALGASITFGFGVSADATYPKRLEEILADRDGEPFEVMNLGVNGYNAYNQAALLADRGLRYRPDLVLTEFCVAGLHDPALHFDVQTRFHFGMIPEEALPNPEMRREPPAFEPLLRICHRLRVCALLADAFLALSDEEPDLRAMVYALRPRELPPGPERR